MYHVKVVLVSELGNILNFIKSSLPNSPHWKVNLPIYLMVDCPSSLKKRAKLGILKSLGNSYVRSIHYGYGFLYVSLIRNLMLDLHRSLTISTTRHCSRVPCSCLVLCYFQPETYLGEITFVLQIQGYW